MIFKDLAYFLSFFSVNGSTVLGNVSPFWLNLPYKIQQKDRYDHMHIIGTTGKGKSKLLEHMLYQDIAKERGVALIDPHGDLADDVLSYLSELSAKLFGGFITTLIQQTAMARRTQKNFFEYLDEFQLFVSTESGSKTFSRTLAEARKRHLYLVLTHQQLSQLAECMRGSLGNVGTLVCFGLDRSDTELQAKRIFCLMARKSNKSLDPIINIRFIILYMKILKNTFRSLIKESLSQGWLILFQSKGKPRL